MKKKSITKNKFISIDPSELGSLTRKQAIPMLREVRALYKKQAGIFDKNPSVYSWAYSKMSDWYTDHGELKLKSITKDKAIQELARLQAFFKSETATVKGSKDILVKQSKMIFGEDENGLPRYKMNRAQAEAFFSLYNEYQSLSETGMVRWFNSNTIQQVVGEWLLSKSNFRNKRPHDLFFSSSDFKRLEERMAALEKSKRWALNVAELEKVINTGKGND